MLSTLTDLRGRVISRLADNTSNLITAEALRSVLFDVIDSCLVKEKHLTTANVADLLRLIDSLSFELQTQLGKAPGYVETFSTMQYLVYVRDTTGLAAELTTPDGLIVPFNLENYTGVNDGCYVANNRETGEWIVLFELVKVERELYNNTQGVPETIGGIEAGTTFENATISEVLTALIYPYKQPVLTLTTTPNANTTLEVGTSFLASGSSLTLRFGGSFLENVTTGIFYLNNSAISPTVAPNSDYVYTPTDYASVTNVGNVPQTVSYSVKATTTKGGIVEGPIHQTRWVHRMFYGWSPLPTTVLENLTMGGSSLSRLTQVTKTETTEESYLHIFLPTSYAEYTRFLVNGLDAVMAPAQSALATTNGVEVEYRVYRLLFPTYGSVLLRTE